MQKLKHFFWLCSGANRELLEKSPTEASKYVGIGATVFFTGVFAAIAGGYALYTVFDNVITASLFGIVWGLMIFNLDRYIVSSMRKEGNFSSEFKMAIPRLILAILISIVIAKPLEMKIFDKEIQAELTLMEQELQDSIEGGIEARYTPERTVLAQEITQLKSEISEKQIKRDELRKVAREEADGTGGTMKRNAGPIYQIKKADADRVEQELEELEGRNNRLIASKSQQLAENDSAMTAELALLQKQNLDGPAGRMKALSRLGAGSWAIRITSIFISLLFIALETAPVFVKLISKKGPYDHLLKIEEFGHESTAIESLARMSADVKKRSADLPQEEREYVAGRLVKGLERS